MVKLLIAWGAKCRRKLAGGNPDAHRVEEIKASTRALEFSNHRGRLH